MKKIRAKARDAAFQFRMGAGFPGDVNRTHPATIEPVMPNATTPPTAYGQAVLIASDGITVRPYTVGDITTMPWGVTVRPFPFQQASGSNFGAAAFGAATPGVTIMDVLRSGYIMATVPAGQTVVKGGTVYMWTAASSGAHVQGGFEATNPGGSGIALGSFVTFNGAADSSGNVELCFNI